MPLPTNLLTVRITLSIEPSGAVISSRHSTCHVLIADQARVSMIMNSAIDGLCESFRAAAGATSDGTHEKGNENETV